MKFILKHCVSEFAFSDCAGACKHIQHADSWGQSQRNMGSFEERVEEREQGDESQTIGESVTVDDCYATSGWARKGADGVNHRRQV